ncbi:MAG: hypothetical protein Q9178_003795 [Gyalolechia marmorata]
MSSRTITLLGRKAVEAARTNGYPNAYWNGRLVFNPRNTRAAQPAVAETTAALARYRARETARSLIHERKARASRPLQGSFPPGRKREREGDEDTSEHGPNKRSRPKTFPKRSSVQSRGSVIQSQVQPAVAAFKIRKRLRDQNGEVPQDGPNKRTKVTAAASASGPLSVATRTDQSMSVKASPNREREDVHEPPVKKLRFEYPASPPITTSAPAPAPSLEAASPTKPMDTINNTPLEAFPKRKAEEDIGAPVKKLKVEQRVENPNSDKISKAAGDYIAGTGPDQGDGKRGRKGGEERATKYSTTKTTKAKDVEVNGAEKHRSPRAEKQVCPDTAKRPARLANAINEGALMCFANSVIQAIDSIPELRNRLIAMAANDEAAFPAFPVRTGSKGDDKAAKRQWHAEIDQMLHLQDRTFGQCLGQTLRHMRVAAQKGDTVCARGLMKMFSSRHPGYDGVSSQQEAFDFLDKVLDLLGTEHVAASDESEQDTPLVNDLIRGQKSTQLECTCGHKRNTACIHAYSLQLDIPAKCRETTILSCLNRALATEKVEGYICESCKGTGTTSKKDYLKGWGNYLVLHLNRADYSSGKSIETKIVVPERLNLDDYVLDGQFPGSKEEKVNVGSPPTLNYEPIAFIERSGKGSIVGPPHAPAIYSSAIDRIQLLLWRAVVVDFKFSSIPSAVRMPAIERTFRF